MTAPAKPRVIGFNHVALEVVWATALASSVSVTVNPHGLQS